MAKINITISLTHRINVIPTNTTALKDGSIDASFNTTFTNDNDIFWIKMSTPTYYLSKPNVSYAMSSLGHVVYAYGYVANGERPALNLSKYSIESLHR